MAGIGDTGTFISDPSVRRTDTELPTKSLILGFRLNSRELYCNEHILKSVASKWAEGQYHTISWASWIAANMFSSAFHWNDCICPPTEIQLWFLFYTLTKTYQFWKMSCGLILTKQCSNLCSCPAQLGFCMLNRLPDWGRVAQENWCESDLPSSLPHFCSNLNR